MEENVEGQINEITNKGEKIESNLCKPEKPICLSKNQHDSSIDLCFGQGENTPNDILNHLIEKLSPSVKPDDKNGTCYSPDLAWLLVIKSIIKLFDERIEQETKKEPTSEVGEPTSEAAEPTSEAAEPTSEAAVMELEELRDKLELLDEMNQKKKLIDLSELFQTMIDYVLTKWNLTNAKLTSKFNDYNEIKNEIQGYNKDKQIAFILLNKLTNLINTDGFIMFSKIISTGPSVISQQINQALTELPNQDGGDEKDDEFLQQQRQNLKKVPTVTAETKQTLSKNDILREIKNLFNITLKFMNDITDLSNQFTGEITYIFTEIDNYFKDIEEKLNLFKFLSTITVKKGGRRGKDHRGYPVETWTEMYERASFSEKIAHGVTDLVTAPIRLGFFIIVESLTLLISGPSAIFNKYYTSRILKKCIYDFGSLSVPKWKTIVETIRAPMEPRGIRKYSYKEKIYVNTGASRLYGTSDNKLYILSYEISSGEKYIEELILEQAADYLLPDWISATKIGKINNDKTNIVSKLDIYNKDYTVNNTIVDLNQNIIKAPKSYADLKKELRENYDEYYGSNGGKKRRSRHRKKKGRRTKKRTKLRKYKTRVRMIKKHKSKKKKYNSTR